MGKDRVLSAGGSRNPAAPMIDEETLARLARESGRLLGELGVGPEDERWIRLHADTIASLGSRSRRRLPRIFYRWARKAARIAR
jgi:hypothetical protein